MMGLLDASYGQVLAGNRASQTRGGRYPDVPLTIWDAIEAANLSGVPGISDAASLAMAGRDVSQGNYGSAALNALGALPFLPGMAGIFIGKKGMKNLGLLDVLEHAQAMKASGASDYDIWQATAKQAADKGLLGGGMTSAFPDKQWRFEIGDEAAKMAAPEGALLDRMIAADRSSKGVSIPTALNTTDVISHPSLETAYFPTRESEPGILFDTMKGTRGSYSGSPEDIITLSNSSILEPDLGKSTMLHELQHAVQHREGFAQGGSPETFKSHYDDAQKMATSLDEIAAARKLKADMALLYNPISGEFENVPASSFASREKQLLAELEKAQSFSPLEPFEMYRRLAGEAEARLVQSRANYTPEMRAAVAPWQQMAGDVPLEQQIVRMGLLR